MNDFRRSVRHFYPTQKWHRSRNPQTKAEILEWYDRELKALQLRRRKKIQRAIEVIPVDVDRETGEVLRKGKEAKKIIVDKHPLSEQDYKVYLRLLEERFKELKREFNQRIKERKGNVVQGE
jgi:hypothetical protein